MSGHRIKLDRLGQGGALVEIDGVNVARSVVALQLNAAARPGGTEAHLIIDFKVEVGSKIESDDVSISVPEATHRALTLLGWTPPGPIELVADQVGSDHSGQLLSQHYRGKVDSESDAEMEAEAAHMWGRCDPGPEDE